MPDDVRRGEGFFLPAATLWRRELVRFVRDRHRLLGAILQPFVFWLLLGIGMSASFAPAGMAGTMSYLEYIYPGALLMVLLFTAIFSTISVVEDRREGFMQSVLVAPVSRSGVVIGKVLGGDDAGGAGRGGVPVVRIPTGHSGRPCFSRRNGGISVSGGPGADGPGFRNCVANGVHGRFPCHNEPLPVADVGALRGIVSALRRAGVARVGDADQSVDVRRRRGPAHAVSRCA